MIPSLHSGVVSSVPSRWADLARFRTRSVRIAALLFTSFLVLVPGTATPQEPVSDTSQVTVWAEVLDSGGFTPETLAPQDLEVVTTGGVVRRVRLPEVSLRRPGSTGGVRWLVYVDQPLASPGTVRRAMDSLGEVTSGLTGLGELEIVSAASDAPPDLVLRTGDPMISAERFSRMALTERGQRGIQEIRERALEEWVASGTGPNPLVAEERAAIVIAAVEEEIDLVRERIRQMVGYLGRLPTEPDRPRVVIPVLDGFDLEPVDYWATILDDTGLRLLREARDRHEDLKDEVTELARGLAASGWIVMPLALERPRGPKGAEFSGVESMDPDRPAMLPGVTVRPGQILGQDDEAVEAEPTTAELLDPLAPLEQLASASGGEVLVTDAGLRGAVDRFADRIAVSWSSPVSFEEDVREVLLRSTRSGWTVRARSWIARGIPEAISSLRLDHVLGGREDEGDLSLAAVLEVRDAGAQTADSTAAEAMSATLDARLDVGDMEGQAGLENVDLQVSVRAVGQDSNARELLLREVVESQDLTRGREWRWRREVALPPDVTAVAVLIEDLASGRWGGRRAAVVRADTSLDGGFLPSPTVVEIRRPEDAVLRGRVRFDVDVWDSRVERISFLLDDREVAVQKQPPWSARLDLGRTPRRQELTVVASDVNGQELGRDSAVLNGGEAGLGVEIVRPETARGTGTVEVEAEISIPVERSLDRVLFFWNNEQVATLYSPPFRQPIYVPEEQKVGYVRVVALLDDGSLAEDVLFLNGPSAGERVNVDLVELFVVVEDKDGRPVRGLDEADFRVIEDGRVQDIATFDDAAELPLTLGMAIDSSASMFVKLPQVQSAASNFLRRTFTDRDRAFLVDFDSQPRLARGTTSDLDRLVGAIWSLEASGRTAMWESIVYSLVQLQGVRGRKALIVFSDGADEDEQFPFRSALRISREMGAPIYLILLKKEPRESAALGLLRRSFTSRVDRLVEATGGRVFYSKEFESLDQIYDQIEEDLRSQYLLAYYPKSDDQNRGWRDVDVEVDVEGLKPRTLSGYHQ
ncbi:MAG: VWA domain-containing protein [Thermoanaerobaculia bacterium]|nr:VWA domain-containing protein [Thermoanaerobaculia bacterium]